MPNVKDLVSRPDNMDETVLHIESRSVQNHSAADVVPILPEPGTVTPYINYAEKWSCLNR